MPLDWPTLSWQMSLSFSLPTSWSELELAEVSTSKNIKKKWLRIKAGFEFGLFGWHCQVELRHDDSLPGKHQLGLLKDLAKFAIEGGNVDVDAVRASDKLGMVRGLMQTLRVVFATRTKKHGRRSRTCWLGRLCRGLGLLGTMLEAKRIRMMP